MNNEKAIYLKQWKDQEKCPDFEPVLIEILDKLERLEKVNAEVKNSYARNIEAMTGQISNDLLSVIKKYPTALPYICELRKEIERLEKENTRLDEENHKLAYSLIQSVPVESSIEQYDRIEELEEILSNEELLRQHMNSIGYRELRKLKEELQATRERLDKATNLLRLQLYAISPSDVTSTERLVKDFLSKNKQKDEVR